jgi:hypothetical protein
MPVREHPAVFMAKPDMTTATVRFGILRERKPIHGSIQNFGKTEIEKRGTHLCRLGANLNQVPLPDKRMGRAVTTFRAATSRQPPPLSTACRLALCIRGQKSSLAILRSELQPTRILTGWRSDYGGIMGGGELLPGRSIGAQVEVWRAFQISATRP